MIPASAPNPLSHRYQVGQRLGSLAGILLLSLCTQSLCNASSNRAVLPAGAVETAQNWLKADPALTQNPPLVFADGWQVFQLERLSDVLRGEFLRAAKPFAWCLPAWDGTTLQGLVQLNESPGAGVRVAGYLTPLNPDFSLALAAAKKQAALSPGATELRELRATEYRLHALWLHSPAGDWFFPTADGEGPERPWRAAQACSAADLASWLRPLAEELIRSQFGTR